MAVINVERARLTVEYYFTHQPTSWAESMRKGGGYSAKASERSGKWKSQPSVVKFIKEYQRKLTGDGGIELADIESRLKKIAMGHQTRYFKVQEDGTIRPDYTDMTDDDKKLIKEVQVDTINRSNGTTQVKSRVVLHDALAALKMLGQMKGAFKDQVEIKGEFSLIERLQRGRQQVIDGPRGHEIEEQE